MLSKLLTTRALINSYTTATAITKNSHKVIVSTASRTFASYSSLSLSTNNASSSTTKSSSIVSTSILSRKTRTTTTTRNMSSSSSSSTPAAQSPVKEEAYWAIEQAKKLDMIGPEDTALIFHSWTQHRKYLQHLKQAFTKTDHTNCLHAIAVKTNPHPAILRQLVEWGFGLECASMEEVYLAMNAGCPGPNIVFDSPVKTRHEIRICHENPQLHGILLNVNSLEELDRIPNNPNFVVGLRINPLVDTGTPEMFQVSGDESKFGTPICSKQAILDAIRDYPVTQLHVHSGTAMEDLTVAVGAIASVVDFATEANTMLLEAGITDRSIVGVDIGGGLRPEILENHESPTEEETSRMEYYVSELKKAAPALWENNMKLVTEFGQWSYFYSGYVYSQIEYTLQREHTRVCYIHLGADMFLRDIYTGNGRGIEFLPMGAAALRPHTLTDIAGPLCFAGDYLQQQIQFPKLEEDDEILMLNTGSNAYGLWSRHCSRTVPQVIGVDRDSEILIQMSPRTNPYLSEGYSGTLLPWDAPAEANNTTDDDENNDDRVASL
jgi:diaminopimelate decarboxylase